MLDKPHLRNEKVVFRMVGSSVVNTGAVINIEDDGFWIQSQDNLARKDAGPEAPGSLIVKS
jgi:hypothetical protein